MSLVLFRSLPKAKKANSSKEFVVMLQKSRGGLQRVAQVRRDGRDGRGGPGAQAEGRVTSEVIVPAGAGKRSVGG